MEKILITLLSYRERDLLITVQTAWENAKHPERLIFSIVSEQSSDDLHPDLSFIPEDQLIYRKYDLSEYRGVMWSRNKTLDVDIEYDYFLQTCGGHVLFAEDWDSNVIDGYKRSIKAAGTEKVVFVLCGVLFEYDDDGNIIFEQNHPWKMVNRYHKTLNKGYVPGYGFPHSQPFEDKEPKEAVYYQGSWVFSTPQYVKEVPIDPDMSYHGEEIYLTVQSWCRGWKFYSCDIPLYAHNSEKKYAREEKSRIITHRPWADNHKEKFWQQSKESMIKLNLLLSGNLGGIYGGITREQVLEYCEFSGLDPIFTIYNPNHDKIDLYQHGKNIKEDPPVNVDF
jgi:hypothetical protein